MDEARVLTRLGRIVALDRGGAAPGELLAELRSLLREAEEQAREHAADATHGKEVGGRLGTARQRT